MAAIPSYLSQAVRVSKLQRAGLAVGAGIGALMDPWRADLVATMLEVFSRNDLRRLRRRVLADPEGRQVLEEQPIISTQTISLPALRALPKNTFGNTYVTWLDKEKVGPDSRKPIMFLADEPELAYLVLRIRQCHDFFHVAMGMPTDGPGELAVKLFEAGQLHITGPLLAALIGPFAQKKTKVQKLVKSYLPVVFRNLSPGHRSRLLLAAYFEKRFEQDIGEFRKDFGIIPYIEPDKPAKK